MKRASKTEFLRIVRMNDGSVCIDINQQADGRGAYVCKNAECLKLAQKNKGLERSFKMSIPKEVYNALEEEFENLEAE